MTVFKALATVDNSGRFDGIIQSAEENMRKLLGLDDRFAVLFLQGGASMQFSMLPMNSSP